MPRCGRMGLMRQGSSPSGRPRLARQARERMAQGTDGETPSLPGRRAFGPEYSRAAPRPLSPGRARVSRAVRALSGRPGNGWLRERMVRHRPCQTGGPGNGRLVGRTMRHRPYRVFLFFTPPAAFFRNLWEFNSCCKEGAVPPNPRWGCLLRYHWVNSSQPKRSGVWKLPLNKGFEARKARWARSMR